MRAGQFRAAAADGRADRLWGDDRLSHHCGGLNARIPQTVPGLLAGNSENGSVDAHAIQPFYTGLLAKACGVGVDLAVEGETVVVTTR